LWLISQLLPLTLNTISAAVPKWRNHLCVSLTFTVFNFYNQYTLVCYWFQRWWIFKAETSSSNQMTQFI
jgi:hypothetical protein